MGLGPNNCGRKTIVFVTTMDIKDGLENRPLSRMGDSQVEVSVGPEFVGFLGLGEGWVGVEDGI